MNEIILEGTPFEIGLQHGESLREDISNFLKKDFAEINLLRDTPLDEHKIEEYTHPYKEVISQFLPEIMEEIEGLAQGAEITIDQAVLLQVRRELVGIKGFTLQGDCSSFGIRHENKMTMGQTIDLPGDMTALGNVFKITPSKKEGPKIMMYSFAGLLGYMGMNSFGVAVAINLVISDGWRVGIPPYLLVRAFLNCKTIEECIDIIKNIPRASSRSFIISDHERQVTVETTPTDYRIIESDFLLHTNHYLHKDFIKEDRVNIFSRNSSIKRIQLLEKWLKNKELTEKNIQSLFADHSLYPVGICAHNEGNLKWTETVAAVIMYPSEGKFNALRGKPCTETYNLFEF